MPRGARTPLPGGAMDRVAGVGGEVQQRRALADLLGAEQFGIGAVQLHRVDLPRGHLHFRLGMGQYQHAALREHDVEVQIA